MGVGTRAAVSLYLPRARKSALLRWQIYERAGVVVRYFMESHVARHVLAMPVERTVFDEVVVRMGLIG